MRTEKGFCVSDEGNRVNVRTRIGTLKNNIFELSNMPAEKLPFQEAEVCIGYTPRKLPSKGGKGKS